MAEEATGRVILVTGSTSGIGRQAALDLARMGARVLLHGRDPQRGQETLEEIRRETGNDQLELYLADLSSQRQIRHLAEQIVQEQERLDVLVNNAGVFVRNRQLTEDGIEMTFAVNHLAPFLLTHLLLDLLKRSVPSRVVTVSSGAHRRARIDWDNLQGEKGYDGYQAYALSKLGNVLFTLELAERLRGSGVTANCLEPGVIRTKLLQAGWGGFWGHDPEVGARRVVYLAVSPEVEGVTGRYFQDNQAVVPSPPADDPRLRRRFWDLSARLTRT
ncbi:MAG: SDR family oxidoreductase [Chloroflexota bacterium]